MATMLNVSLSNQTTSSEVYAYVTGSAINQNGALFLLEFDGQTPYYPAAPSSSGSPLGANCAIPLGPPGSTTQVTIPQITNGRVWFSVDGTLTFLLNPGPDLSEPSITDSSDPNYNICWDFCEITYSIADFYANISYVDFVCLPIALHLTNTSGDVQSVSGIPQDGLNTICSNLRAQDAIDGAGWSQLVVARNGANLRVLSPNNGISVNSALFGGYFEPYVNAVRSQYTNEPLTIDTQSTSDDVTGQVNNGVLNFNGIGTWSMPSTADIFNCSTGPFANTSGEAGNISARLCAGFNRSTLLIDDNEPDSEVPSTYYQTSPTNHYARIVHAANDGEGYTFPYDDVGPPGGPDLSGSVNDSLPQSFTITVGGANATVAATKRNAKAGAAKRLRRKRFLEAEEHSIVLPKFHRRQVEWNEPNKTTQLRVRSVQKLDLEKGDGEKLLLHEEAREVLQVAPRNRSPLQRFVQRLIERFSKNLRTLAENSRLRTILEIFNTFLTSFVSASTRAVLTRAFFTIVLLLFYLVVGHGWNSVSPARPDGNRLKRVDPGFVA